MKELLDFIYNSKELTIEKLYSYRPFNTNVDRQYPGNVIQFVLMQVADIDTSKDHEGFTKAQWLGYKKKLFNTTCRLIDKHNIASFTSKDSAVAMYRIGLIVTSDLKDTKAPIEQIDLLLTHLHEKRAEAAPQAIANTLWALARLISEGVPLDVTPSKIADLLTSFHRRRTQACPQNTSNALWALGKLIESNRQLTVNASEVGDLVSNLHAQRTQTKLQELTNSLWAIGIITANSTNPANFISPDILDSLYNHMTMQANFASAELTHKHQIITAISLLHLENQYDISPLIKQCRPPSTLSENQIKPHIKNSKSYEFEAFICGFYVDLLVTGKNGVKTIVEFDGPHHHKEPQKSFDIFRDAILKKHGYAITRVSYDSGSCHALPKQGFFANPSTHTKKPDVEEELKKQL